MSKNSEIFLKISKKIMELGKTSKIEAKSTKNRDFVDEKWRSKNIIFVFVENKSSCLGTVLDLLKGVGARV